MSFHPPTRLLIARGTDEQLDLVREAIEELVDGAERRREESESLREEIGELESQLNHLSGEVKVAEQTVALTKARLDKLTKSHEAGTVTYEEVAGAELEATRAETELSYYKDQSSRLRGKLEALREALRKREQPRE